MPIRSPGLRLILAVSRLPSGHVTAFSLHHIAFATTSNSRWPRRRRTSRQLRHSNKTGLKMLSSGFTNAPVSKVLVIYIVASSIALSIFDAKHLAHILVVPHLWHYAQFSRILLWQIAGYANSTEVLFAAMLAYHLRVVERMWGSRKLATFLVAILPYTTIIAPLLLSLVLRPLSFNTLNYLPSGPTAVMFALLAQYHASVPHTFKYRISTSGSGSTGRRNTTTTDTNSKPSLTILLSDKSTTYLVAAQLALSQFPASLLPAITGWAIGVAWRADILPTSRGLGRGWRVPAWMVGEKESASRRYHPAAGSGSSGEDGERYENIRRRLDAAAAAQQAASSGVAGSEQQRQRRPLLERLTSVF
ncbi:hypothetical protein BGW36DRAFT_427530 [Talaromyces proteolyticus]|uniref:DSC E3 ubiquitin ligase complex subunit 2 n=1 Tax=Talaromyces proteolyticus TaxID=1131652 RepID=A0AAD4KS30_9EURO|nr:uncharacterized protein BGW36DRAFT_427530 [Talaromyces proteolyticus]KAH8697573.1 hypothetical protein BGW36DRAFT_427530 [Talaromyces proteolyticus]